jgi:hypothetical protein
MTARALSRYEAREAAAKQALAQGQIVVRHPDSDEFMLCGTPDCMTAWAADEARSTASAFIRQNDFIHATHVRIDVVGVAHFCRGTYLPAIKAVVHWSDAYAANDKITQTIAIFEGITLEALQAHLKTVLAAIPSANKTECAA